MFDSPENRINVAEAGRRGRPVEDPKEQPADPVETPRRPLPVITPVGPARRPMEVPTPWTVPNPFAVPVEEPTPERVPA